MQNRWSSLPATHSRKGRRGLAGPFRIVRHLESIEALALDALAHRANFSRWPEEQEFVPEELQGDGNDGPFGPLGKTLQEGSYQVKRQIVSALTGKRRPHLRCSKNVSTPRSHDRFALQPRAR
jgi:hypothetical protein